MARTSRLPGFYKVSVDERRTLVSEATGEATCDIERALESGGLDEETADKFVENVIGTYGLPYGVALNVRVNGRDYVVPMVVEEPSVVAAASNAARMVREGGGFHAEVDEPLMIAQVQLTHVRDREGREDPHPRGGGRPSHAGQRRHPEASSSGAGERAASMSVSSAPTTTPCSSFTSWSTAVTRWAQTS